MEQAVAEVRRKVCETQDTLAGAIEPVQMEALHHFARVLRDRVGRRE